MFFHETWSLCSVFDEESCGFRNFEIRVKRRELSPLRVFGLRADPSSVRPHFWKGYNSPIQMKITTFVDNGLNFNL